MKVLKEQHVGEWPDMVPEGGLCYGLYLPHDQMVSLTLCALGTQGGFGVSVVEVCPW